MRASNTGRAGAPASDRATAILREGMARHGAGDLDGAEALYRRALEADPGSADALNLLGVVARGRGDAASAVALTGRALAVRPDSAVYLASHGAALAEAGRTEEAVAVLSRAVGARPGDGVARRNLGQALCALGRAGAALPHLRHAVALRPGDAEVLLALAHGQREAGDAAGAVAAARRALSAASAGVPGPVGDAAVTGGPPGNVTPGGGGAGAGAPGIAEQARFLLAALGAEGAPDRAPAAYVRDLFDAYAPRFDADLTGRLDYRTPEALAGLVRRAEVPAGGSLDVLDLGCGTGLSGVALRPFARRMVGVDLSPRMLAEAARTGAYDALEEADLLAFLPAHPSAFGLVAAADVLNYLGDLGPALAGIAGAVVPGGHAAFSIETGEVAPYALGEGMRYRHHPGHVLDLAARAGLREVAREETVLRRERGAAVAGTLLVLRKGSNP